MIHLYRTYFPHFLLFSLLLITGYTNAQSLQNPCGTDLLHQRRLETDSLYRSAVARVNKRLLDKASIDLTTQHTIPVVFVVYNLGEAVGTGTNVSDATLLAELNSMNNRFKTIGSNPPGADTRIQFALAQRTTDCQPFTGIIRVNASTVPTYAAQGIIYGNWATEDQLRQLTPSYSVGGASNGFITIHIVSRITGAAAYASFGGSIFCDYRYLGALTHEMGHIFFLHHTFQGSETGIPNSFSCPANTNPLLDGDQVADTDPHKQNDQCQGQGNDTHINTCTGMPFGSILYNFMSYSCGNRFTAGQVVRMRTALYESMSALINSSYLTAPQPNEAIKPVSCSITLGQQPTAGWSIGLQRVQFGSLDNSSDAVPFYNGYYHDYSCLRKTVVTAGTTYSLITTSYAQNRRAYLDYNNDGVLDEATERIHLGSNNGNWGTKEVRGVITIPTTAVRNTYLRLRIVVDPGSTVPSACNLPGIASYGYGEIEDYGVLVQADGLAPALSITTWPTTPFCTAQTVSIPLSTTGIFGPSNQFSVLLSDAAGSFASPITIGSGTIQPISAIIPTNLNLTGNYRIRVTSSSPALVSNDSPVLNLESSPTATLTGSQTITTGQTATLAIALTGRSPWETLVKYTPYNASFTQYITSSPYNFTVAPATTTTYSVVSVSNQCGFGIASGSASITVPCLAPTTLSETDKTLYYIKLNWDAVQGASYTIQWKPTTATTWTEIPNNCCSPYFLTGAGIIYGQAYQWRVKTVCAGNQQSDWSAAHTFVMDCPVPFSTVEAVSGTQAKLSWFNVGTGVLYTVQWRQQGNPNWTVVPGLTSSPFMLTGLTAGNGYEWQVRSQCSDNSLSAYSLPRSFTTQCGEPINLSLLQVSSTGVRVGWVGIDGLAYRVRWRLYYGTTWMDAPSPTTNTRYDISGLSNNTFYVWQVQTVCSPTESSTYVGSDYFYTRCEAPTSLSVAAITPTTAQLVWSDVGFGARYDFRWRAYGTSTWTTISALTTTSYSVTGLTSNQYYEWQISVLCSDGQASDFSNTYFFYPTCPIPTNPSESLLTSSSVKLNWTGNAGVTNYSLYWRSVPGNWNVLSVNNTTTYSLTGLTANSVYLWQVYAVCSGTLTSFSSDSRSFTTLSACNAMTTLKAGSWADPAVWSCNRVPTSSDAIEVRHAVLMPVSIIGNAKKITYGQTGKLIMEPGAKLILSP